MKTHYTTAVARAARCIQRGGVVAFPTETVYGLGASALNARAVAAIFRAKGRPGDNPLIVHVASRADVLRVAETVPPVARRLMDAFWPGPLTLVLPRHPDLPDRVTAGLATVGVRLPAHPLARAFLRAAGTPVAAPSANRSGRPSPTTWRAVKEDLDGRIACVLKGNRSRVGLESTVVDCTGPVPIVLRAGSVSLEQLRAIAPRTRMANARDRERGRSPGLRHRHYAPKARVVLGGKPSRAATTRAAWIGIGAPPAVFSHSRSCRSVTAYAREVFHFFRECEAQGIRTIYCAKVPEIGIGAALMDRLRRAARATC
ncbi:MAG TPA: L-threonylcarbamoyladenylate synthase [Kiritimatiellia bacterium]|nr:L-threonylcarbamoyladenylate synthase [Kiritimatiellia bacterium]